MEHRWGERVEVDIPVRLTAQPFCVRAARLTDLSLSGAFINAGFDLRELSRIQVVIEPPLLFKYETPIIAAYVARKFKDGIGVEWCEFAPQAVIQLIRSVSPSPAHSTRAEAPGRGCACARVGAPYAFPKSVAASRSILTMNVHPSSTTQRVPGTLLPDLLHFDPTRPASYPNNGRTLTDDALDHFLSVLTNGKVTTDGVGPHIDLRSAFPYLGPPHNVAVPLRPKLS